jgi:hypothetical protein
VSFFSVFSLLVTRRWRSGRHSALASLKLHRRGGYSQQVFITSPGSSPTPNPEVKMTFHLGWQLTLRRSTPRLPFQHSNPPLKRPFASRSLPSPRKFRRAPWIASAFVLSGVGFVSYDPPQQFAHTLHAVRRCSRIAEAVVPSAIDYKRTLSKDYASEPVRQAAMSECHTRSAKRVLQAMLANGGEFYTLPSPCTIFAHQPPKGIYIKMGQTMASL